MSDKQKGNTKIYVLVGVLVLVGGAVMLLSDGFPPGSENAKGTIAPAERYRAPQIDSDDVDLGDQSVTLFMQTDEFERLMSDEAFLEVVQNADFQAAMNNADFRLALNNAALVLAVTA